jgi:multiple sugar transport system permease protein
MLNNVLYLLFGIDGPIYLNDHWTALASNIGAYIWKTMPFWTIILLAGRMAIPQQRFSMRMSLDRAGDCGVV